jgi:hypothetical protein
VVKSQQVVEKPFNPNNADIVFSSADQTSLTQHMHYVNAFFWLTVMPNPEGVILNLFQNLVFLGFYI